MNPKRRLEPQGFTPATPRPPRGYADVGGMYIGAKDGKDVLKTVVGTLLGALLVGYLLRAKFKVPGVK